MKKRLSLAIASAFHIGFIPGAPGTYASAATTLGFFLVCYLSNQLEPALHLSAVCLISLAGIAASNEVCRITGAEDPSFIVIDEVAGQLLTFLFLPLNAFNLILGTLLFRLFDIWKPFPIRKLESLKGGAGIMADDLLAGVYGNIVLQLANILLRRIGYS
jgi:phosphatidylglycerophosphatase A